jgi:hypothetical protein
VWGAERFQLHLPEYGRGREASVGIREVPISRIKEPARGVHNYQGRITYPLRRYRKWRARNRSQRTHGFIDDVRRNVAGISIRHVEESPGRIHRHRLRKRTCHERRAGNRQQRACVRNNLIRRNRVIDVACYVDELPCGIDLTAAGPIPAVNGDPGAETSSPRTCFG